MPTTVVLGPLLRHVDRTSAAVWVQTSAPAIVSVQLDGASWQTPTFTVHGHHYALVEVTGLAPGTDAAYRVELDGVPAWPAPDDERPAGRIRTLDDGAEVRLGFGSCRTSVPHDAAGHLSHGVDALRALGLAHATGDPDAPQLPDTLLLLGDQVYADVTSAAMREFIASRRSLADGPGEELADFEEYAHLYLLAWGEEWLRWLLTTLPTLMIFDDHDVRDDWNTSAVWREQMAATSWWAGRIVAALASYWVYQHVGNLSVGERAQDEIWVELQRRRASAQAAGGSEHIDLTEVLDAFAARVDAEPDSYRWSFARDFGDSRLVVIDSRAARVMGQGQRSMLDEAEMRWLDEQLQGGPEHLLIGTSLPFLLPGGLHHLEAWNEATCNGVWGSALVPLAERVRQAADLEHWAAFHDSFEQVCGMVTEVATGRRGPAPASVIFLSGDVHHSYIAEVERAGPLADASSAIYQLVCSPIRNPLPRAMRMLTGLMAQWMSRPFGALASRSTRSPVVPWQWETVAGPWYTNNVAILHTAGPVLDVSWWTGRVLGMDHGHPRIARVADIDIKPGVPVDA